MSRDERPNVASRSPASTFAPRSGTSMGPKRLGAALPRIGMTANEAALVLGGNMMRVAQQVWG